MVLTKGEKEVIDLMREWKDEIVKLTDDYKMAIQTLGKITTAVENTRSTWATRNKYWVLPVVSILAVALLCLVVLITPVCSVEVPFLKIKIVKECGIVTATGAEIGLAQ